MMFKDNPEGQTQYDLSSRDSTEEMRREFDKAGYWPNEVMWKAWQQSWNAAIASKQEELNAAIATKQTELERWQIVAENWRVHAVDWVRKNADLTAELAQVNAAIASKQEELEGLRAAARFWYDKAGDRSDELKQANATIAALEAKRDGAIEQWLQECEIRRTLEAKELELLGVIEQMREAIKICVEFVPESYEHPLVKEALSESYKIVNKFGRTLYPKLQQVI